MKPISYCLFLFSFAFSVKASDEAELAARAEPRCLTARRVASFDGAATLRHFRAHHTDLAARENFVLLDGLGEPESWTCWDVQRDAKDVLHVALYYVDSAPGKGVGAGDSVEVAFAPYGDTGAFVQAGASGETLWFNEYWPYRDGRVNLARRFARELSVTFPCGNAQAGERMVVFHVPVAAVSAPESKGLVGFNMMRCSAPRGENATWNPTCGVPFPDASGFGFLRLDEAAPRPAPVPRAKPLAGKVRLQVEYDWPDEMCGGPYSPEALKDEFRLLKSMGVGRLYWIDYPGFFRFGEKDGRPCFPFHHRRHVEETAEKTFALFHNEDVMFAACRFAHELGMEFYVTIKPYDQFKTDIDREGLRRYGFRRNPAWTQPAGPKEVTRLVLARDGERPIEFDPKAIRVLTSVDNRTYAPAPDVRVEEQVEDYLNTEWTPAGNRPTGGTHKVRTLSFTNLPRPCEYVAFEFPKDGGWTFRNLRYELVAAESAKGPIRCMCTALRSASVGTVIGTSGVYEFVFDGAVAGWMDTTEAMDREYGFSAGGSFAVRLSEIAVREDILDPTFPEVRRFWNDFYVRRAIKAGVDGVDVRVANHCVAADWLASCYAEPVLAAFRAKYGREPACTPADYEAVRRIRGEGHTAFLREAAALLHAKGLKLEAHVEARMKAAPSVDAYQGIHFDWATWIDEKIVDGINLKYLGPFNRFVAAELMPRAQRNGIEVSQISATIGTQYEARAAEENASAMELCRLGGVGGYTLYEAWCHLRTLPSGDRTAVGSALQILKALRPLARGGKAPEPSLRLAAPFGDHAVLQRGKDVSVRGFGARPGERLRAKVGAAESVTHANPDGSFCFRFAPQPAGGPFELTVVDGSGQAVTSRDVYFGEVWLCSGQSNMARHMRDADPQLEGCHPLIRQFAVARGTATEPLASCGGEWVTAEGAAVKNFTAVGAFFAAALARELGGVAVGLLNASEGGTDIQQWSGDEALRATEPGRRAQAAQAAREKDPTFWEKIPALVSDTGVSAAAVRWSERDFDDSDWS